jgi:hypothetical protein
MHSSDEDWDLQYPRNSNVEGAPDISGGEIGNTDGEDCSYTDLYALHAHRSC